jgi:hypothetical protein
MITYADVAETLSAGVREAIEVSQPCRGGHDHLWEWDCRQVFRWGEVYPVITDHWWVCVYCGVRMTETDPRPAEARDIPLVSARLEDFL